MVSFIINPSQKEWDEGDLELTVASTRDKGNHDRGRCQHELSDETMIDAIYRAHDVNQSIIKLY
jgi:polyribonucleotide nucleotidyltransferase